MNWLYKINIKQYLGEKTNPAAVVKAKREIIRELKTIMPFNTWPEGQELVRKLDGVFTCDSFNRVLSLIYDFADRERIWLGIR